GSRRGHLARQLHAIRSRILRSGAENPATARQPVRHEVVTHVLGTTCYLCLRAGQERGWRVATDSDRGAARQAVSAASTCGRTSSLARMGTNIVIFGERPACGI